MHREQALRIVMIAAGLLFTAGVIPLTMLLSRQPPVAMLMSLYVPLGIFLLLAARNPAENRSLIAFAGWANLAHAALMAVQEYLNVILRRELAGVAVFGIIGAALVALTPAREPAGRASVAASATTPL